MKGSGRQAASLFSLRWTPEPLTLAESASPRARGCAPCLAPTGPRLQLGQGRCRPQKQRLDSPSAQLDATRQDTACEAGVRVTADPQTVRTQPCQTSPSSAPVRSVSLG